MLDCTPPVSHQRSTGAASVRLGMDARGALRIGGLAQAGSAKAFLPRVHGGLPEVVFLNTSGGLTGGDSLSYSLVLEPGTAAVGTTQTAERAYRSTGPAPAHMAVRLDLGPGAQLDWLPQETILFEGAHLARRTEARLAGDARLLMLEILVLGRAAMGETLAHVACHDLRHVSRDGVPVLIEPVRLTTATLARRAEPAGLGGARAVATLALIAPGAEDALGALRAALPGAEGGAVRAAASGWGGRVVARFMAPDLFPLKRALLPALAALRTGAPLPRVWQT